MGERPIIFRDLKLKGSHTLLALSLAATACSQGVEATGVNFESFDRLPTPSPTAIPDLTALPVIEPSTETRLVRTVTPTATHTPEIMMSERNEIRSLMEKYGRVDEHYLSNEYWMRYREQLQSYGEASRILSLEFHGDNYWMYDGGYSMTPESFEEQMQFLMERDYHFVTAIELEMFITGKLPLPARSIVLTTDSGNASHESIPRITLLFQKLEREYGYRPHMISAIWTMSMDEGESILCEDDACWSVFRNALDSGYFSFGTHTESHRDFASMSPEEGVSDIRQSINEIRVALGITVRGGTWPFESCPDYSDELGLEYFFGGRSYPIDDAYVHRGDELSMCLPRLFPPNPNGVSGRPNGLTLEQMLFNALSE